MRLAKVLALPFNFWEYGVFIWLYRIEKWIIDLSVNEEFQGICGTRDLPEEFSEALGMPGKSSKQFQ
jgi:hypothetical protein